MPTEEQLAKLLPELRGVVDPKAELQLYLAFRSIYEYIDNALAALEKSLSEKVANGSLSSKDVSSLVNLFSTPLAGSNINDPLLQSIVQSFGSQAANLVFASPSGAAGNPLFRALVAADAANNLWPMTKLDQKVVKTDDGLIKDVTGAPIANDGFVTLKDNNGHTVKVGTVT